MINSLIRNNKIIYLILLFALILRLVSINQSLWLDEAIGAEVVINFSYKGVLSEFVKFDNHPPSYYFVLKFWTSIFGFSEPALRFPSIIFGVLTVFLTYKIAKKLTRQKDKHFPIASALLLSTSQLHIYYSQEARMYAMAAFLATLSIYSFLLVLGDRKVSLKYWLIFSFSTTFLIFTDYLPVFLLPVFWILGFITRKRTNWWKIFVLSHVPMLILGILWFPTFLIQSQKGKWLLETLPGWRFVAGGATIKQVGLVWTKFVLGRISLANKAIYYSLIVLSSIPILLTIFKAYQKRNRTLVIIFVLLLFPLILGFITSFFFPAFIYFRFLYVLPAFYLVIGWGVSKFNPRFRYILVLSLIAFNILSWIIYVADVRQQREQWREATAFIEQSAKKDEVVIFEYPEPFTPYRWYAKGNVEAVGVTDSIYADRKKTKEKVLQTVSPKEGVYYFEYLRDLSDPQRVVEETLGEEGFEIINIHDYVGVGQVYYFRRL